MGENRSVERVLVKKTEGNRLPGRPKCGWENDIEINLNETESERVDWIILAQDKNNSLAVINRAMNICFP
jgi:hypothetical protein